MSDGRRGRGITAAGGDARAPSSGFPRHIPHSSRRDAARGAHLEVIGPLQAAASGGAGRARVSQRRFHAQRVVPLPHGSSVERVEPRGEICEICEFAPPHVPRNRRPEIGSPKRSEAERFSPFRKRDRTSPQTRSTNIRVKDDQSTLRAHSTIAHLGIGLHTSANVGRLASCAAGDPGGRRSDSSPTAVPFSTPPSLTGVRPSTVSLRPTSLMRSLIVALTLRSRFPLTIARSSGHLNGRVFAPDPRIPPTHSRQNECPHGSVTGELDSPSLQKSRRHTAHRRSSRSLRRMRCRGVPAGVPALLS